MKFSRKRTEETFVVKIKNSQHNTWQGSVLWVDDHNEKNFRSALELLKLLDEAVTEKREENEEIQ